MSRKFTPTELSKYNGVDEPRIYVALRGTVFDVTDKGQHFYGKGSPYAMFAGHDASRGLATLAMNVKDELDDLSDLTPTQKDSLDGWHKQFVEKYVVVGTLE